MNRDDIIRMAREAGISEGLPAEDDLPAIWTPISTSELERFAALIAAAEREKFCSDLRALHDVYSLQSVSTIRARGQS